MALEWSRKCILGLLAPNDRADLCEKLLEGQWELFRILAKKDGPSCSSACDIIRSGDSDTLASLQKFNKKGTILADDGDAPLSPFAAVILLLSLLTLISIAFTTAGSALWCRYLQKNRRNPPKSVAEEQELHTLPSTEDQKKNNTHVTNISLKVAPQAQSPSQSNTLPPQYTPSQIAPSSQITARYTGRPFLSLTGKSSRGHGEPFHL